MIDRKIWTNGRQIEREGGERLHGIYVYVTKVWDVKNDCLWERDEIENGKRKKEMIRITKECQIVKEKQKQQRNSQGEV